MNTYWYMFTYWLTWFFFCWLLLSIPDRSHPITISLPVNMWGLHGSDVTILKILVVFSCHSSPILWYPSIVHTEQYFRSLHGDVWLMLPRPRKTHGTKIKPHSNPDISPRSWRILAEDRVPSKWKTTNAWSWGMRCTAGKRKAQCDYQQWDCFACRCEHLQRSAQPCGNHAETSAVVQRSR